MTNLLRSVVERVGRFFYDPMAAQYEFASDLRPVLSETIANVIQRRIDDASKTGDALTSRMLAGNLSVAEWRDGMATELRRATSQMYALGNGGWRQIDQADRGAISERLKSEFGYLRDFAKEIAAGDLSDAEIRARAQLYSNKLKSTFWEGQTTAKDQAGYTEEHRTLGATEKHCSNCPGYAGHWEPIGTLPDPGDECECGGNCLCTKSYR